MSRRTTLADRLRRAIRRDGRSIYQLAIDSGVARAVLVRFVNGDRGLNLDTADRVCKVLRLDLRSVRKEG